MLVLAHRGHHETLPENTLAAFESAIKLGCHGIETDLRASADGEAVLIHDRIAPNGIPVSQQSRRELEQAFGHPIPTLEEALALKHSILWNIEIKTPAGWALAKPILAVAQERQRLLISSFNHGIALEAADKLGLSSAFLSANQPPAVNTLLYSAQSFSHLRHIVWDFEIMDRDQILQCNALGFHNWAYGPQTRAELELCRDYGLHAVITDIPAQALELT